MRGPQQTHARIYQACEACRERKVKCDLGPVDKPQEPPCARCRRESKECSFNVTRKRLVPPEGLSDQYIQRNKRRHMGEGSVNDRPTGEQNQYNSPEDAGSTIQSAFPGNIGRAQEESESSILGQDDPQNALLSTAAYTSNDALSLLYLAGRNEMRDTESAVGLGNSPATSLTTLAEGSVRIQHSVTHDEYQDGIKSWAKMKFCYEGLFTPTEALTYVEYFQAHLASLTPISVSAFRNPSAHKKLLEEEPILAMTMLMLASRYVKLSGPAALSRGYVIHDRLWAFLQNMISRVFWARDLWSATDRSPYRTLGTCEALLLLLEWHPRSLHFPTGEESISVLVNESDSSKRVDPFNQTNPIFWMEWSWRSDRISSSLLGFAQSLATEIGVFREYGNLTAQDKMPPTGAFGDKHQQKLRLRHLLWLFWTYTSDRSGWKHLMPSQSYEYANEYSDDAISLWSRITSLLRKANETLFATRAQTTSLIKNGRYLGLLFNLQPLIEDWHSEFEKATVPFGLRAMLTMEYGYTLVYINSIALQAVVENGISGKPDLHRSNSDFLQEVVRGAMLILETVVKDLRPLNRLMHIPVRAYSRIMTSALFLLKAAALNSHINNIEESLHLVDSVGTALEECVVDDVNLSTRWGQLLHRLTANQRAHISQTTAGGVAPDNDTRDTSALMPEHRLSGVDPDQPSASHAFNNLNNLPDREPRSFPIDSRLHSVDRADFTPVIDSNSFEHLGTSLGPVDWLSFPLDPLRNFDDFTLSQTSWGHNDGIFDVFGRN